MYQAKAAQRSREKVQTVSPTAYSDSTFIREDGFLNQLLDTLYTSPYWSERQVAARKLGDLGSDQASNGLSEALLVDSFWMVRCTIIQALEKTGNDKSKPALQMVAATDQSNIVRQYAAIALRRLSGNA